MQQAVDATEVHEGAVVGDVLHHAVQDHAFLEALDQLAALLRTGFFQHRAARHHDVPARAVHLEDLEGLRGAHQRADIAHRADIHLRTGQERDRAAEVHGEATLHAPEDHAIHADLRGEGLFQVGPGFLAPRLLARQDDGAVPVLVALDEQLDQVAGLHLGLHARGGEFLEGHAPLALQADIDDGNIVIHADDLAGDDRSGKPGVGAKRFVEKGGEILAMEAMQCCAFRYRPASDAAGDAACAPARKAGTTWPGAPSGAISLDPMGGRVTVRPVPVPLGTRALRRGQEKSQEEQGKTARPAQPPPVARPATPGRARRPQITTNPRVTTQP